MNESKVNLTSIEAAARAATPGPWAVDQDERPRMSWNRFIVQADDPNMSVCFMAHSDGKTPAQDKATAEHIASCSPDVVLALVEAVRAATNVANRNRPPKMVTEDFAALRKALEGIEL